MITIIKTIIYKIFILLIRKLSIYIINARLIFYREINYLNIFEKIIEKLNLKLL